MKLRKREGEGEGGRKEGRGHGKSIRSKTLLTKEKCCGKL